MDIKTSLHRIKETFLMVSEDQFDSLTKDKTYTESFLYFLLCHIIALPIVAAVILLFPPLPGVPANAIGVLQSLAVSLILGTVVNYMFYLIAHTLVRLLGGKASLLQTVQVMIYGATGVLILGQVPFIALVFGLIALVNVIQGLKRVHGIPLWKSAVAVLVPIVLLMALLVLLMSVARVSTSGGIGPGQGPL